MSLLNAIRTKDYFGKSVVVGVTSLGLSALLWLSSGSVFAETGDLGGTADSSVDGGLTSDQANSFVNDIKNNIPEATHDDNLKSIVHATETGRKSTFDSAGAFAQPIIMVVMWLTNVIWFLVSALFMFQTAVDVVCISLGLPVSFAPTEGGNGFLNLVKSFFHPSPDCIQILGDMSPSSGSMGNRSMGGGSMGGRPMGGSMGGRPMGGSMGGRPMGGSMGGGRPMGGQQGGSGSGSSRGNLLVTYFFKRIWTLIFLFVSITVFGTSMASDFGLDFSSYIIALIKGVWSFIDGIFHH